MMAPKLIFGYMILFYLSNKDVSYCLFLNFGLLFFNLFISGICLLIDCSFAVQLKQKNCLCLLLICFCCNLHYHDYSSLCSCHMFFKLLSLL